MAGVAALAFPGVLVAQGRRTVAAETRFYATVGGTSLGLLSKGSSFTSRRSDGTSVELLVEGWVLARSVGTVDRDGFDLQVTPSGGQNLHQTPSRNGRVVGKAVRGALLEKVEADGKGWVHVRRYVWVPGSALEPVPVAAAKPRTDAPRAAAAADSTRPAPATAPPSDLQRTGRAVTLTVGPEGAPLASLPQGSEVRVITRAGEWTQVSVTGWVRSADLLAATDPAQVGVSAAQVRADPAQYVGKVLEWRLQFVAVMVADELRPEIPPGRSYLLTRGPLPESGFVYVVLPNDQVDRFRRVPALGELTLRVQVRAARTKYLPNPVVDLLQVISGA